VLARALFLICALLLSMSAPAYAATQPIAFTRTALSKGNASGVQFDGTSLVLAPGETSGMWTAEPTQPGFGFDHVVASWDADTPADGSLTVQVQATTAAGPSTDWYTLGIWAADDRSVRRTSLSGQRDALGRVDTDTLRAQAAAFTSYTLGVRLDRASADDPSPSVRMLGASVSNFKYVEGQAVSTPIGPDAVELPVPPYSQEVHAREYPQWGGGGEAWCSPTSTEMVVEFWGRGPSSADVAWVQPNVADPSIDYAARFTYDAAYRGTGNWPFNAAYAARFGLDAFVTQLRSLSEAEQFIRAGIPLVASIASRPGELDGFLFSGGTNGHLVVIVGFDASGNPIVNDPAAWSDASVRRAYDRAQFERVWLRGSGGTVYVIHPPEVPLPPPLSADSAPNW
jgi:Peptidase_C39 like family